MAITTSQQLNKYFDSYKSVAVTYTKEVVQSSGLQPQNVLLKCLGEQWPCVLYTSTFESAKILAPNRPGLMEKITKANGLVSIRLSFRVSGKTDPVQFFISGKVTGYSAYAQSNGTLQFIAIQFTQRPPEDFIDIIGRLQEANAAAARRRDERILLTPDSMRRIGLAQKETTMLVEGVPRRCILRDLSFSGSKAIIMGVAKFLVGKNVHLKLELEDPEETVSIPGAIVRYEDVEGRKELTAIAIEFDESKVPLSYKMHLNDYLGQQRKGQGDDAQAPVPATPASEAAQTKSQPGATAGAGATPGAGSVAPRNVGSSAGNRTADATVAGSA